MILETVSDVIYEFYERGRPLATAKTYGREDISMFVRMALSSKMVRNYYDSKKLNEGDEYYITSALLSVKRFSLSDADARGARNVDMSEFDLYRLPQNAHVTNAYPVGCSGSDGRPVPILRPGDEKFYTKTKFKSFKFGIPKGRSIYFYHIPPCVKSFDIESTFDSNKVDISLDVAYDISREILGVMLNVPFFIGKNPEDTYSQPHAQLRQRLTQQQDQNPNG
jgi:hypothetical protein